MRFFALTAFVAAAAVLFVGTPTPAAATFSATSVRSLGTTYSSADHYGAPTPPWEKGATPGWYYGNHPDLVQQIGLDLIYLGDSIICLLLELLTFDCLKCPKAPPPPPKPTKTKTTATATPTYPPPPPPPAFPGWNQTITNYTAAVQADDYLTFGLVDTIPDCIAMCESVTNCNFFNTYHDVNGKGGSPLLTCALFSKCHTAADADNRGGQSQPDGSVDFITNSDGFCKD